MVDAAISQPVLDAGTLSTANELVRRGRQQPVKETVISAGYCPSKIGLPCGTSPVGAISLSACSKKCSTFGIVTGRQLFFGCVSDEWRPLVVHFVKAGVNIH